VNRESRTALPQGAVRRALPADAAAILELEAHFDSDQMSARSVRAFLRAKTARVWVAELDAQVVGNLVLLLRKGSRAARIYSVVVSPLARGRRFGERLVHAAEHEARALGLAELRLEVKLANAPARALYAKLGYVEQRALPGFYEDGSDGLRLVKSLAS
jgi:ribosomal protein S18 acetylase RimI-like enzyme